MNLDESAVGALRERFQPDPGERGLDSVGVTARYAQGPGLIFQRVQPGLAQRFSLAMHPFVVQVWQ